LGNGEIIVKMTSKLKLGKWVEGKRVSFHFYLVMETCKFTLKKKFPIVWKRGRIRDKYCGERLHYDGL